MEYSELIRVGKVVARKSDSMHCQVQFSDTHTNPVVTHWLPVLVNRASKDTYYDLPDIDDNVLCLFLPNGHEVGFILGSYYPTGKAPLQNADVYQHKFADGTFMEYNRQSHKLTASCVGDVEVQTQGDVNLQGQNIILNATEAISLQAPQITSLKGC